MTAQCFERRARWLSLHFSSVSSVYVILPSSVAGVFDWRFCLVDIVLLNCVQHSIGVDLAGLLGGRMASAEGRSVPSGVRYGEGCPLSSQLGGLRERHELPQCGPGQSPNRKWILAYFEGHRTLIFVPI